MLGHGSPGPGATYTKRPEYGWTRILCSLLWLLLLSGIVRPALAAGSDLDLRLHITWGGGSLRAWQGVIRLNEGTFVDPVSLGQEADDVAAYELVGSTLKIAQRSASRYSGIDVVVRAPAVAELSIEFAPSDRAAAVKRIAIPVSELIGKSHNAELDDQKNSILVSRAPGDRLRVRFDRESLVFAPEERFDFDLLPHHLGLEAATIVRCKIQLLRARSEDQLWFEEKDVRVAEDGNAPEVNRQSIPLPDVEGVYDVAISLFQKRLTDPINPVRAKPFAARKIQLVVVAPQSPRASQVPWKSIGEIDPIQVTNLTGTADVKWTDWLKRMPQLKVFPSFNKGPIGNNKASKKELHGNTLLQLERDGWLAYPLPTAKVDEPHILDLQYPAGLRQSLSISIIEPNAAGKVVPIGLDSGVDVPESTNDPQMAWHRLVFWPHTKTPLVLIANRRADGPAMFGKLSVLAGPATLPPLAIPNQLGERELTAFFDKPLFAKNFGALEGLDAGSQRTLDDWGSFYFGGKRLVEYLKYTGYNSAVITVACEGSAIYPSRVLQPTPKYDSGVLFSTGQDPVRKDVLEMLFRLFDREGLKLIPAVQFASPLPELEVEKRRSGNAGGIVWVNAEGQAWGDVMPSRRGLAPHYNPLNPKVRQSMRNVVAEVAERYSRHASFGGVSMQLGPDTFAQLPNEAWGFDDATIAALEKETRIRLPGGGAQRFAERAAYLQGEGLPTWLRWRAGKMTELYGDLQRTVAKDNASAKLYVTTADILNDRSVQAALRPTLPSQTNIADALLHIGIDTKLFMDHPAIILSRPQREAPIFSLNNQAVNIGANLSNELDRVFADLPHPSVQHYHEVFPLHLPSFDAVSPFGADHTHTSLMTHFAPGGPFSRRRFVHSLATCDAQIMLDGGWMLSLGEEESLRPLIEIYRQLPATKFADVTAAQRNSTQPLVVRKASYRGQTYVYAVNDSRWPITAEVDFEIPGNPSAQSLDRKIQPTFQRQGNVSRWSLHLTPYDVQAIAIPGENTRVADFRVKLESTITNELSQQIEEIRGRANSLRNPKAIEVLRNPGFELIQKNQPLPGWVYARGNGIVVAPDAAVKFGGNQSLLLRSNGPVAWVRSEPFPAPTSGRIALWVWLKVSDVNQQPPLRLAIEGKLDGQTYYRFATVGAGKGAAALQGEWRQFRFQVTDLPPQGLSDLRIGFDLMGAGEVWIDDVQLYDMWFFNHERDELLKRIAAADYQLEQGWVLDCAKFLDSYWPRLLAQQIPIQPRLAQTIAPPPPPMPPSSTDKNASPAPPPKNEAESKGWRLLPKSMKLF